MLRNAKAFAAALVVAAGFAVVGPAGPTAAGPPRSEGSTILSDYRKDPYLSPEQKELLAKLAEQSKTGVRAESWAHGGTVGRMELEVRSGLAENASLAEHALAFVQTYGPLWKINRDSRLQVVNVKGGRDCSTVTLTLAVGETPVFNATITVVVGGSGVIRGTAGRLSGESLGEVAESRVSADRADSIVRKHISARSEGQVGDEVKLPRAAQVVVDPFFLADGAHAAGKGWLFTEQPGGTGQAGVFVVSGQTGAITVSGPGLTVPGQTVANCPGSNPTKVLVPFILDPMTNTPAYVDLRPAGVMTAGLTATDRAYDLMSRSVALDLFGDRNPRHHLRDAQEFPGPNGRTTVRFREYFADIPVEGSRLSVTLLANGRAESITARFVYFPHIRIEPGIKESDALSAATARYEQIFCNADVACLADLATENAARPPVVSLSILSSEIFVGTAIPTFPKDQERLTYKVEFPRRTMFWDAHSGTELYGWDSTLHAVPHTIRNAEVNNGQVEIVDGTPAVGITPHLDATRLSNWFNEIDQFYLGLGRNGVDGLGTRVAARVREREDNAFWCPVDIIVKVCGGDRLILGVNYTSSDIAGHEFTHGVVEFSANFVRGGEPGALNEHYADLMGNLAFPDSNPNEWLVGENSIAGALRDMADPGALNQPGHYGNMGAYCSDPNRCAHSWAGVPNRAAVLIADGGVAGSGHPGIGRDTIAALYLATLTGGLSGSSDLFLSQRVNTMATCTALVGQSFNGRMVSDGDCDHIGRSFDTVGVTATTELGWTRFSSGLFGNATTVATREGQLLFQGCTMANQILRGEDGSSGDQRVSDVVDGLKINFANEWGADVTVRGAAISNIDRSVTYVIWTSWFNGGVVDVDEVYNKPNPSMSDDTCRRPMNNVQKRSLFSTTGVSHWSTFFDGGKGDDPVNVGRTMPPGCMIESVRGLHYHHWSQPEGAATVSMSHNGNHGYTVSRTTLDPSGLDASVHWWFEAFNSIKVRVQYDVFEPAGTNCLVPGLQPTP